MDISKKKEKALKKARAKNPYITDEAELEKIAAAMKQKKFSTLSKLSVIGGGLCIFFFTFIKGTILGGLLLALGIVALIFAIICHKIAFPAPPKEKNDPFNSSNSTLLELNDVINSNKRSGNSFASVLFIALFLIPGIAFLVKGQYTDAFWMLIITIVFAFFIVSGQKREEKAIQRNVYNNEFRFLKTTVADKYSSMDAATDSHVHYFVFNCEDVVLEKMVSSLEYKKRSIGEGCYLLLFLSNRRKYYIQKIIWPDEATLSQEMKERLITEKEVAQKNRY